MVSASRSASRLRGADLLAETIETAGRDPVAEEMLAAAARLVA